MFVVMSAAPVAMIKAGHSFDDAATALQYHMILMFLPGLLGTGDCVSVLGPDVVAIAGCALYVACGFFTYAAEGGGGDASSRDGRVSLWVFQAILIALGLAWNLLFVSGSGMMTPAQCSPTLTRAETRDVACLLREDYEKGRGNTDKVKANELEAIAALHDALPQPGPLSVERDPAEVEKAATARDVKKAPTPEWLLRVGLSTLGQSEGSYLLVAEGLDAVSSALAALAAAAAAAEEEEDDEGEEDDGNARAAAASGAANAALDRDT